VNAIILSQSGGTCVCKGTPDDPICAINTEYNLCKDEIRKDLITVRPCAWRFSLAASRTDRLDRFRQATAGVAAISSFLMGALANLPVGLGPGMGCKYHLLLQRRFRA
jgi:AGZA family xanthine/uracil permease-like MFS transporter